MAEWLPAAAAALRDRAGAAHVDAIDAAFPALAAHLAGGAWPPRAPTAGSADALLDALRRHGRVELDLLLRSVAGSRLKAAAAAAALLAALLDAVAADAPGAVQRHEQETLESAQQWVFRAAASCALDAADAAGELVDDVARLAPWASWHTRGSALEAAVLERLDELAQLLARRPELEDIAEQLGRLEAAERAGRSLERGGRQTVVGVRVGGELADALACELALLADPETEPLFYARLAERRLLSLELGGDAAEVPMTTRRPGPVIACVDTSGSMRGAPERLAKAALLALARRVLGEGRRMVVLLFGGRGAYTEVALAPGRVDLPALFRLLLTSYYGGTDFDGPIARALALRLEGAGMREADLLLVTDGLCRLGPEVLAAVAQARAHDDLEVASVVIGEHAERVEAFSDRIWKVPAA